MRRGGGADSLHASQSSVAHPFDEKSSPSHHQPDPEPQSASHPETQPQSASESHAAMPSQPVSAAQSQPMDEVVARYATPPAAVNAGASTQPSAPKKKKPHKGFLIFAVVAAVLLLLGVLANFAIDETPDEYAGVYTATIEMAHDDGLVYNDTFTLVLEEDGACSVQMQQSGRWLGTDYGSVAFEWTHWKLDGSTIVLSNGQGERFEAPLVSDGAGVQIGDGVVLYRQ